MPEPLRTFLDFAIETAVLAGRLTLGYYQTRIRPDFKVDDSPVTIADRKSEELIRARIERHYPHHAIVGEEYGATGASQATHRWFIDPIDGTKAFIRGVPLYAVLLGLEIEQRVEVGVAYFPALNELLAAAMGEGCWWNGRRAHVSNAANLKQASACHGDAANFDKYNRADEWNRVKAAAFFCSGLGDAYGYLLVATGRAEVMLDPIMNVWDCAPFPPILQEAGGYFGDWQGNATIYAKEAMATTQVLLPEVLRTLRGDK